MNRQNIGQNFFVVNLGKIHDDFARSDRSFSQRGGNLIPIVLCNFFNLQRVPDKFQSNVVGQLDFFMLESVVKRFETLVADADETLRFVRSDEQIKRRDIRQLCQPLKFVKIISIVPEELGELIPKQNQCRQLIFFDDFGNSLG